MNDNQTPSVDPVSVGGIWSVDADAPLQSVLDRPDTPPLLRQALTGVLSWQARNEMPVRRTLVTPRTAPQWVAALLALGATITVEGEAGPSESPLDALLQRTVEGGISTLHVPTRLCLPKTRGVGRVMWGEAHVARTPTDEPIVAAVAAVEMDGNLVCQARVALTGVWPEPARLAEAPARLISGPLDDEHIQAVAAAVEKEVTPRGDFLGSEEYRRAMAGVLTRRALEAAWRQGKGRGGRGGREGKGDRRQEVRDGQ